MSIQTATRVSTTGTNFRILPDKNRNENARHLAGCRGIQGHGRPNVHDDFLCGIPNPMIPPHGISASVSYKSGDGQPSIRFRETDKDLAHYAKLATNPNGSHVWQITAEINRRQSPPVTHVSFLPASYAVSVEDQSLPDLLSMSGAEAMHTKYLVTVFTEKTTKTKPDLQIEAAIPAGPSSSLSSSIRTP